MEARQRRNRGRRFPRIPLRSDTRRPEIRRALAAGLHAIVRTCEPRVAATSLPRALLATAGAAHASRFALPKYRKAAEITLSFLYQGQ
jgi:hypothetical protein